MERKLDQVCLYEGEEYLTCEEVISFLHEYLADEISPARRREFERHLAICDSCVAYLETYRETIRASRELARREALAVAEPPAELVAAILAALATPEEPESPT
jgi:anti-sigma factor RsiW